MKPKKPFNGSISVKLLIMTFFLTKNGFLMLLGAPNEFLRLIITHYMFKYSFRIKTTLLDALGSRRGPLKARFR